MWSAANVCRCSHFFRNPHSNLLFNSPKNVINKNSIITRQLIYPVRKIDVHKGFRANLQVSKLTNIIKSNLVAIRQCSSSPKPKNTKLVGYWLVGCCGMVFTAVVLGGVTRLTESGLSMVTWKLLGEKMPKTELEWQTEFEKYQKYPEFIYKNRDMTLSEFKWIWYMEFAHRSWGRAIGLVTVVPAAAFWYLGYLNRGMKVRVAVYTALVAAQGLMGWYMVKSGLEDRFQGPSDVPRVSQYRLAAHLGLAFILYSGLVAGALRMLRPFPLGVAKIKVPALGATTGLAHTVKAMAFFTALSGAFVAGLDAGLVYNSFPKMGDAWVPDDILALNPARINFTENPTTVQFDHRILGIITLLSATAVALVARRKGIRGVAGGVALAVGGAAWLQATLGILTLLNYVPTPLAASHQAGSLGLLTLAVWLTHEVKLLKYIPK